MWGLHSSENGAARPSETSISSHHTTRRNNPENHELKNSGLIVLFCSVGSCPSSIIRFILSLSFQFLHWLTLADRVQFFPHLSVSNFVWQNNHEIKLRQCTVLVVWSLYLTCIWGVILSYCILYKASMWLVESCVYQRCKHSTDHKVFRLDVTEPLFCLYITTGRRPSSHLFTHLHSNKKTPPTCIT